MPEDRRKNTVWAVCFTFAGAALLDRLLKGLRRKKADVLAWKKGSGPWPEDGGFKEIDTPLTEWMGQAFQEAGSILVVGATGIAVRAASPWIRDKFDDPAMVVMDEKGRFAIPVLSGHWGRANELASGLAALSGGTAVITTATDVENRFAVDVFAKKNGLWISDRKAAKQVSADILAGIPVKISSSFPQEGDLPPGCEAADVLQEKAMPEEDGCRRGVQDGEGKGGRQGSAVVISVFGPKPGEVLVEKVRPLYLVPRLVTVGIGCRKDMDPGKLKEQVMAVLQESGIWPEAVEAMATIDLKEHEPALLSLCREMGWELKCFSADELNGVQGEFFHSDFVERTTGVGNVCERAAVLACGGRLIVNKQVRSGVTVAAALRPWTVKWQEDGKREDSDDAFGTQPAEDETRYTYVNQTRMRRGITTGTCAAAAASAAAASLLEDRDPEQVTVLTPKGIRISVPVSAYAGGAGWASCQVRKDAGDDPDVTDGAVVEVRISRTPQEESANVGEETEKGAGENWYEYREEESTIYLRGGRGVGLVTRAGLSCPPGMWAINPVPRQMIFRQTAEVMERTGEKGPLYLTVSVPDGDKLALKTFNPRLGIRGGISILGTSGIVEPMSQSALIETIRLEIRQRAAEGETLLLAMPGNYGFHFLRESLGLPAENGVKCSNFIGETIDMAVRYGFRKMLLVGHAGKLIKVAAGVMNTHSSMADGRLECLAAWAGASGAGAERVNRILSAVTADEALLILEEQEGLRDAVMEKIMGQIARHLARRAGEDLAIEAVLFTNERGLLGMTSGAGEMIKELREKRESAGERQAAFGLSAPEGDKRNEDS